MIYLIDWNVKLLNLPLLYNLRSEELATPFIK